MKWWLSLVTSALVFIFSPSASSEPARESCRHVLVGLLRYSGTPSTGAAPIGRIESVGVFLACDTGRIQRLPIRLPWNGYGDVGREGGEPVLSPDDRWIAFTRNHNVVLLDLSSGQEHPVTRLTDDPAERLIYQPYITSWAPDSRSLLYCVLHARTYLDSTPEVVSSPASGWFIYDLAAESSRRVSLPGEFECWLRDDEFVICGQTRDDLGSWFGLLDHGNLFLCSQNDSVAGTQLTECCGPERVSCFGQVTGSPGGSEIALHFSPSSDSAQIARLDVTSRKISPITEVAFAPQYQWPRYSPTGRHLAFVEKGGALHVDGRVVGKYSVGARGYFWITDGAVAVISGDSLGVIGVNTGEFLGPKESIREASGTEPQH